MLFSAKAEYACLAMLELAVRHGDPKPARLADIADTHGIPQRFLVQILLQLKSAGLVSSTRGAAGGYHLARPPEKVSIGDIIGVIERSDTTSTARKLEATPLASALHAVWDRIAASRQKILADTSLADMLVAGQGLQYVI